MNGLQGHSNPLYQTRCKHCGKPRYGRCEYALCENHYLEYTRKISKAYYQRNEGERITRKMATVTSRIVEKWPTAQGIRSSGKCPRCKRKTQYSFILPEFLRMVDEWEECGYWCSNCSWSNAGRRLIEDDAPLLINPINSLEV